MTPSITYVFNPFTGNFDAINTSGGSTPSSFAIANNVVSFTDITGFLVDPTVNHAFTAETSIERSNGAYSVLSEGLDPSFNTNGGTGPSDGIRAISKQSTGDFILGGEFTSFNSITLGYVAAVSSTGVLDSVFNTNLGTGANGTVRALYTDSSNGVYMGGAFTSFNGNSVPALYKTLSTGAIDSTIMTNLGTGFALTAGTADIFDIKAQSTGKVIVAGGFDSLNGTSANGLIRLNTDGTIDTTFLTNIGTAFTGVDGFSIFPQQVLVLSDDTIVLVGAFTSFNGNTISGIVKLNSDGTYNTAFNTNISPGLTNGGAIGNGGVVLAGDSMVIVGTFTTCAATTVPGMVEIDASGNVNATFVTNIGTGRAGGSDYRVVVDTQGNIFSGGFGTGAFNSNGVTGVAILNPNGTNNTAALVDFGSGMNAATNSFYALSDGRVLIGGFFTAINSIGSYKYLAMDRFVTNYPAAYRVSTQVIKGVYDAGTSTWFLGMFDTLGTNTGVSFSMEASGQLQYTSSNLGGAVITSLMKYEILGL